MNQRQLNNVRADALSDQVGALRRDGEKIPDDIDLRAVCARQTSKKMPDGLRQASENLRRIWAEETDVDFVE